MWKQANLHTLVGLGVSKQTELLLFVECFSQWFDIKGFILWQITIMNRCNKLLCLYMPSLEYNRTIWHFAWHAQSGNKQNKNIWIKYNVVFCFVFFLPEIMTPLSPSGFCESMVGWRCINLVQIKSKINRPVHK